MCFHDIPRQAGRQAGRLAAGRRRFPVTHYDHREKQENGIITVMTVVECHRNTPNGNVPAHCALDNNKMFRYYFFSRSKCRLIIMNIMRRRIF